MSWYGVRLALAIPLAGISAISEALIYIIVPEIRRPR